MATSSSTSTQPLKELNNQTPVSDPTSQTKVDEKYVMNDKNGTADVCKCKTSGVLGTTPDRIKVPKWPFKYPERYTSPTDHMISPISKGLLARGRRGGALLPPSKIQSKIRQLQAHDVDVIKIQL